MSAPRNAYMSNDEREHDLALLRGWLKPGDVVLTATLHRSRSGLRRVVGMWAVNVPERAALVAALAAYRERGFASAGHEVSLGARKALASAECRPRTVRIWALAARVLRLRVDLVRGGVVTDATASELVGDLALTLYGDRLALVNEEL